MSRKIAAVVLSAGRSSRMAPRNKLLEPVEGKPIIAGVAEVALASGAGPVIVVTGCDAGRIEAALAGLKATIVHNAAFEDGLSSSLRTGLDALPSDSDGALILLGDMLAVEGADLDALMAAFTGPDAICVPVRDGRQGNPILWGSSHFAEMMALTGDIGAKQLIGRHPDCVIEVPAASPGIFADVDTKSDLARLRAGAKERRSR